MPVDAIDPDLGKFAARGGKLLLYNGWNDTLIPPGVAVDYYKSVVAKMGQKKVQSFMRFYMVPDMAHCPSAAGTNAYTFDTLGMIEQWKENGKAPDEIVATHHEAGAETGKRLVCQYPEIASYKGSGSTDDPANFSCKAR
jgi:feruloyl esterase